jgi:ubiquinone/menaquinone biosynthesis C-methylase UbiE
LWIVGIVAALVFGFGALRVQGRLAPGPMPFWLEGLFLENPLRRAWFPPGFVLELAGTVTGLRVGEVGTGVGVVAAALAAAVGPEGRLWGVDRQAAAVRATAARLWRQGYGARVRLDVADARDLPWPSRSLDLVVMVAVLGEVPPPGRARALAEARRVLREDGRLVVVEYWPDPHYLSEKAVRDLVMAAGFDVAAARRGRLQHGLVARPRPS